MTTFSMPQHYIYYYKIMSGYLTDCYLRQGIQGLQESMGGTLQSFKPHLTLLTSSKIDARKKEKAKEAGWF